MTEDRTRPPARRMGDAALRAALQDALRGSFATPRAIVGLRRRPSEKRSSFALEELEVALDDGRSLALIWKDLGCKALVRRRQWAKPASLCDPRREMGTYLAILAPAALGTAICYGAVCRPRLGRYWLFLERVPGQELHLEGWETWLQVARWLARLHGRFAGVAAHGDWMRPVPLLRYDAPYYRRWLRRAQALGGSGRNPAGARRGLAWLARRYDGLIERLVALPATFIHGEFYASNVLVGEDRGGLRVCPIDWEMAAVGPGVLDLAALSAGNWTAGEREALARAYHSALAPAAGRRPDLGVLLETLDYCRLHLAVQWLGWSTRSTAAPHETHDWLGDALSLAEKLGL